MIDVAEEIVRTGDFATIVTCGGDDTGSSRADHRQLDPLARGAARRLAGLLGEINPQLLVGVGVSLSPVSPERVGRHDTAIAAAVVAALRLWSQRGGRLSRLLALSSTVTYGFARGGPLLFGESADRSDADADPVSAYGSWVAELREMERLYSESAQQLGFALCLLRSAAVVGGPTPSYISDYLAARVPVRVAGYDPPIQLLDYADLINAIGRAANAEAQGIINVVGRGVIPLSRLVARAGRLAPPLPMTLAHWVVPRAVDVATLCWRCVADGQRAGEALGFVPTRSSEDLIGS